MNIMNVIKKWLSIILVIISFVLIYNMLNLGVIPTKYLIIFISLILIIDFVIFIFSFKKIGNVFCVILILLAIMFSTIESFGIYYLYNTNKFFNNISELNEKSSYYLVVKKESRYENRKDLNEKKLGILSNKSDSYVKAIEVLFEDVSMDKLEYGSIKNLVNDLYDEKIDCLLINSNNYDLFVENLDGFADRVKVIDKIIVELQVVNLIEKDDPKRPFNLLISGIDVDGPIETTSRSDVNIIVTVNPNTHKILLTHIPRDYYVCLHGIENGMDKLTHAGMYGIDMSVGTIEDFMDIDIDYYLRVNFDTLIRVVDSIGGIDVYSDASFWAGDAFYFNEGYNHMNGKEALAFSRERKVFAEGDRRRGKHQEQVIDAIFKKVSGSTVLLSNYSEILGGLSNSFQTNISEDLMKAYIKNQLNDMASWNIESISVNGEDYATYNTYSLPDWYMYLVYPDQKTIDLAHNKITSILNEN